METLGRQLTFERVFLILKALAEEIDEKRFKQLTLELVRLMESDANDLDIFKGDYREALSRSTFKEKAVFSLAAAALADHPYALKNRKSLWLIPKEPLARLENRLLRLIPACFVLAVQSLRDWRHRLASVVKLSLLSVGNLKQNKYASSSRVSILRPWPAQALANVASWPEIAIVIPSYNQGKYLRETLDSLLSQRYPKLALHIQDGASTDDTLELLQYYETLYPAGFTYVSEPDRGQADAINRGFELVAGDIMGWINSDDLALPDSLQTIASEFARDRSLDVVYGDRLLVNASSRIIGRWCLPAHEDSDLLHAFWIPQETMFWRRSAWNASGQRVDADLQFALDWDLVLRFRAAGCKFKHIPFYLGALRVYPEQKSQDLIQTVGLREMDLVRMTSPSSYLVPRSCREHQLGVKDFLLRQKLASARAITAARVLNVLGIRVANRFGLRLIDLDPICCRVLPSPCPGKHVRA